MNLPVCFLSTLASPSMISLQFNLCKNGCDKVEGQCPAVFPLNVSLAPSRALSCASNHHHAFKKHTLH